ncbi:hypothetical protein AYO45_04080 [Gammaproteobacteria bacterium SCGC AG-212-F23]|nr:hypothetical protein AYO45_04080 [Gammaproteobacteria bacterium SCGC AG-212-F23]
MQKRIIVWDLGATKCAAGLVEYHPETHELSCRKKFSIKIADADSLENLVLRIEEGLNLAMADADAICIGAAGQFNGESLHLESGYPYSMHFAQLAKQQHWAPYHIVHDYVPIVCATFTTYMHQADNVKPLNQSPLKQYSRRVACGIGTGLGLKDGVLLDNGDFWLGYNEIGHIGVTTPPSAEKFLLQRHREFIHFLQQDQSQLPGSNMKNNPSARANANQNQQTNGQDQHNDQNR